MNQPQFKLIVDDSIALELPKVDEAPILFDLIDKNRAHLRQFLGWLDFSASFKDTAKFISEELVKYFSGKALLLTIKYHEKIIGVVSINEINQEYQSGSIGYWLDESHQGKGIMTRSVEALVKYAFEEMKLHRLEIRIVPHNTQSAKVAERLGFFHEATLKDAIKNYGQYFDAKIFTKINQY